MTEDAAVTISEIRTLVGERQRFDEWLSALESRRAETPERVFLRVHGDYVARRDAVIANLHEHVGTLESLEQDLNSRLHSLETQLAEREDERAEAMLRTAVGEFDSERWESTRHEVEASLAELGTQRESLMAEAEDTRALLASARHKPAQPEVAPEPQPVVEVAQHVVEPIEMAETEAPALEHAANTASRSDENADADIEAAFAITDTPAHDSFGGAEHDHASMPAASASHAELIDAQLDVDVDAAVNMLGAAPGSTVPESLDNIDVFGEPNVPMRGNIPSDSSTNNGDARPSWANEPASNGTATRDAFDDLAFLRSVTESGNGAAPSNASGRGGAQADQTKTLRCTECGTMNFPTEWYCERCGGELAAF